MFIIELTENQFINYSKLHSARNYKQTVEYAKFMEIYGYKKVLLGLSDERYDIHAACLILLKDNFGIVPNGYLISNNDYELLEIMSNELVNYFKTRKINYLRINPLVKYKEYDKDNNIIYTNNDLVNNYLKLGYKYLNNPKKVLLYNSKNNINNTYNSLDTRIKKSITKANNMAINIYKGNIDNIELFNNLIKDKNFNIDYYKRYFSCFNTPNNKVELYFAKLDTEKYLNNFRYLLSKEQDNNWKLQAMMQDINIPKTDEFINEKMQSDKLVNSYNNEVLRATAIFKTYPKGLVIGTNLIIKNNKEVFFIKDGYETNFKTLFTSSIIKWEIIKKYIDKDYAIFNFGEVIEDNKKTNFDGSIIEYPGEFDLIINKYAYKLNNGLNKIKITKK